MVSRLRGTGCYRRRGQRSGIGSFAGRASGAVAEISSVSRCQASSGNSSKNRRRSAGAMCSTMARISSRRPGMQQNVSVVVRENDPPKRRRVRGRQPAKQVLLFIEGKIRNYSGRNSRIEPWHYRRGLVPAFLRQSGAQCFGCYCWHPVLCYIRCWLDHRQANCKK